MKGSVLLLGVELGGGAAMDEAEQLCEAARNGDIGRLKSLIGAGADVSHFDADGLTPLMHAAKSGRADAAKALLEAGAPWNALSPSNLSAGDFAMESGHQEAFELLLNAGTCASTVLLRFVICPW